MGQTGELTRYRRVHVGLIGEQTGDDRPVIDSVDEAELSADTVADDQIRRRECRADFRPGAERIGEQSQPIDRTPHLGVWIEPQEVMNNQHLARRRLIGQGRIPARIACQYDVLRLNLAMGGCRYAQKNSRRHGQGLPPGSSCVSTILSLNIPSLRTVPSFSLLVPSCVRLHASGRDHGVKGEAGPRSRRTRSQRASAPPSSARKRFQTRTASSSGSGAPHAGSSPTCV